MDDIQKQAKDLMNKMSNPFKPKFKGQGHRLGGSDSLPSTPSTSNSRSSASTGVVGKTAPSTKGLTSKDRPIHPLDRGKQEADKVPRGRTTVAQVSKSSFSDARQEAVRDSFRPTNELPSSTMQQSSQIKSLPSSKSETSIGQSENRSSGALDFQPSISKGEEDAGSKQYECPICQKSWKTSVEVEIHVEDCLSIGMAQAVQMDDMGRVQTAGDSITSRSRGGSLNDESSKGFELNTSNDNGVDDEVEELWEVHKAIATLISAAPSQATMDILEKVLKNIINDPSSEKFRRLRMKNPKISELIGKVVGAMELLQAIEFQLIDEEGEGGTMEVMAVMKKPDEAHLVRIEETLRILETHRVSPKPNADSSNELSKFSLSTPGSDSNSGTPLLQKLATGSKNDKVSTPKSVAPPRRIDRKTRVFLPAPENVAARIEIPDSFFVRSAEEVRADIIAKKKMMENSQMLVTRAWREKQASANKRRYSAAILRIQFPDMLVLEGIFHPSEPTSAIYEFVAEALFDPVQEFQLCHPIPTRNPFIPSVATPRAPIPTLEEADLVPASLIKFRPSDIGVGGYTGLKKNLIMSAETLVSTKYPQ